MRVICINNKPIVGLRNKYLDLISEGNIYVVFKCAKSPTGRMGYILEGIKKDKEYSYDASRFIECSELDEMQLVNELVLVEK